MSSNPFNPSGASPANPFAPQTSTAAPQVVNGAAQPPAQALEQVQEPPIDLNDPLLTSESLTVAEGDAFAEPAPPPDRKWRVKLKLEGVKKQGTSDLTEAKFPNGFTLHGVEAAPQKDKSGNTIGLFLRTVMSVTILDANGKYDGLHLQVPFYYMDTKPNREGISKIMTVLNLLRKPDGTPWVAKGEKLSHPALMDRFIKALAGEPEVGAESEWEFQCDVCQKIGKQSGNYAKSVRGMNKFPPSKTVRGEFDHEMICPVDRSHGYSKARPLAARFVGL